MLVYESIRYVYYYFHYIDTCSAYSHLVLTYLIGNFLWVSTIIYGFSSIDTRHTRKIRQYYNSLIIILITRITVYAVMAYIMIKHQTFNRSESYEEMMEYYIKDMEANADTETSNSSTTIITGSTTLDDIINSINDIPGSLTIDEGIKSIVNDMICSSVY
jgi:hypothetical protein